MTRLLKRASGDSGNNERKKLLQASLTSFLGRGGCTSCLLLLLVSFSETLRSRCATVALTRSKNNQNNILNFAPEAWPLEMADEVSKVHHVHVSWLDDRNLNNKKSPHPPQIWSVISRKFV